MRLDGIPFSTKTHVRKLLSIIIIIFLKNGDAVDYECDTRHIFNRTQVRKATAFPTV